MTLRDKRLIAFVVLFLILDAFVTYHSFWQRVVVVLAISSVTWLFLIWEKENK